MKAVVLVADHLEIYRSPDLTEPFVRIERRHDGSIWRLSLLLPKSARVETKVEREEEPLFRITSKPLEERLKDFLDRKRSRTYTCKVLQIVETGCVYWKGRVVAEWKGVRRYVVDNDDVILMSNDKIKHAPHIALIQSIYEITFYIH